MASCIGPINLGEISDGGEDHLLDYFIGCWEGLKVVKSMKWITNCQSSINDVISHF